jgi:hypothetical protein
LSPVGETPGEGAWGEGLGPGGWQRVWGETRLRANTDALTTPGANLGQDLVTFGPGGEEARGVSLGGGGAGTDVVVVLRMMMVLTMKKNPRLTMTMVVVERHDLILC